MTCSKEESECILKADKSSFRITFVGARDIHHDLKSRVSERQPDNEAEIGYLPSCTWIAVKPEMGRMTF